MAVYVFVAYMSLVLQISTSCTQVMTWLWQLRRIGRTGERPLSVLLVTFIYWAIPNVVFVIFLISDYLLSFCIANEKDCPQPKHINKIFTQQVSYSRRKLQREKGKCAKYDQDSAWRRTINFSGSTHVMYTAFPGTALLIPLVSATYCFEDICFKVWSPYCTTHFTTMASMKWSNNYN